MKFSKNYPRSTFDRMGEGGEVQQLDVPQEYRKYYNIALKKQRKKGNLHLFIHFNPRV